MRGAKSDIGVVVYYLHQEETADNGRAYSSKATLCQQFAQSYLKTINKTYNLKDDSEEWKMAIDIETDMYNLCLLDLNKEALKDYRTTALEKYQLK